MFIKYTLQEEIILPPEIYAENISKAVRNHIFSKYLFKIVAINSGSQSIQVICIKIDSIEILDNIILRNTAQIKIKILLVITVLRLLDGEYYEGEVSALNQNGITVKFLNGLLEGTIPINGMHADTIFSQQNKVWILSHHKSEKGYEWKLGSSVRFKIWHTNLNEQQHKEKQDFAEMITLRADKLGLGPKQWWV